MIKFVNKGMPKIMMIQRKRIIMRTMMIVVNLGMPQIWMIKVKRNPEFLFFCILD